MQTTTSYIPVASHEAKPGGIKKCVLLYSGGLDTSTMLKWIQEQYQCELITLTLDLGQQADDLDAAKEKALALWASKAYILDVKNEFANEYITLAIKANASYQGDYHLSTPIWRPLLAKKAVEIAHKVWADCIAHGATGKGNDQVRIESSILCLDPDMKIIAPVRQRWLGRQEQISYAQKHNIPIKQTTNIAYSRDDNMRWVTGEGSEIEDPKLEPHLSDILQVTNLPEQAPNKKEQIEITFKQGVPTHINGTKMSLTHCIQTCNSIWGKHGIWYTILIEDRYVGLKVRGVYENPGAHLIITAHQNLEKIVSNQEENSFKEFIDSKWAYLCYNAKRYDPTFSHLNAYIVDQNQKVTGTVTLSMYKGKLDCIKVISPYSLFDSNLATFEKNASFNQNASAGFTEISSLAMVTHHRIHNTLSH